MILMNRVMSERGNLQWRWPYQRFQYAASGVLLYLTEVENSKIPLDLGQTLPLPTILRMWMRDGAQTGLVPTAHSVKVFHPNFNTMIATGYLLVAGVGEGASLMLDSVEKRSEITTKIRRSHLRRTSSEVSTEPLPIDHRGHSVNFSHTENSEEKAVSLPGDWSTNMFNLAIRIYRTREPTSILQAWVWFRSVLSHHIEFILYYYCHDDVDAQWPNNQLRYDRDGFKLLFFPLTNTRLTTRYIQNLVEILGSWTYEALQDDIIPSANIDVRSDSNDQVIFRGFLACETPASTLVSRTVSDPGFAVPRSPWRSHTDQYILQVSAYAKPAMPVELFREFTEALKHKIITDIQNMGFPTRDDRWPEGQFNYVGYGAQVNLKETRPAIAPFNDGLTIQQVLDFAELLRQWGSGADGNAEGQVPSADLVVFSSIHGQMESRGHLLCGVASQARAQAQTQAQAQAQNFDFGNQLASNQLPGVTKPRPRRAVRTPSNTTLSVPPAPWTYPLGGFLFQFQSYTPPTTIPLIFTDFTIMLSRYLTSALHDPRIHGNTHALWFSNTFTYYYGGVTLELQEATRRGEWRPPRPLTFDQLLALADTLVAWSPPGGGGEVPSAEIMVGVQGDEGYLVSVGRIKCRRSDDGWGKELTVR